MEKLLGFSPDLEPTLSGVITACSNFIPYQQGMRGAPTPETPLNVPALAAACIGAGVVTKLDGTRRIFAGTATKLYELSSGAWSDVARVGDYTGGADTRWSITQYGNSTIAANGVETIQRSDTSGDFADISGAPIAKIVFSVGAFVMALNVNDGASKPDGWHCCASFDDTDWTESVATLSASGRLVSTPGELLAGGRLGEYAIAYKEKAIYVGQFVGAPAVWDWTQVPGGDAGCVGIDAWCDIGGAHFFVGQDNIWVFDGSRPVPIATPCRQWFFDNSSPTYRYKTQCVFDRQNNAVWIFYCSTGATTPDAALVYHIQTKQWGLATIAVESALNYVAAGVTIDDLDDFSATIDGLSGYSFDSQFWLAGGRSLSIFNASHQLQSVTGATGASSFTTGDAGDDEGVTLLSKIRLRFAPGYKPTTATVTTYTKMNEGDDLTSVGTSTIDNGKFDVLQSARWHRATFSFTGNVRVLGIQPELTPDGLE